MTTEQQFDLRDYGPGKFSLMIDEYVWTMGLDGGCDDDFSHEGFGFFGMMQGPLIESLALSQTGITPTSDEFEFLRTRVGCILRESNETGFVTVDYYDNADELQRDWERTCEEYTESDGLDDDLEEE